MLTRSQEDAVGIYIRQISIRLPAASEMNMVWETGSGE
jgi:hypothetical protein